jgi:hypothetical protein
LGLVAEDLSHSNQPLVPEKLFISGGGDGANAQAVYTGQGLLGTLIQLLVAEKSGFQLAEGHEAAEFQELADRITREAMNSIKLETALAGEVAKG